VNVFPPVTVMGTFAVSGSGAGTWTEDPGSEGEIDTALYADAQLECEVINQPVGAQDIVVTVIGTNRLGGAESHGSTIPNGSIVGTKVAVGTADDRFAKVTNVTITGGTAGDDFQVQSKEDRTL